MAPSPLRLISSQAQPLSASAPVFSACSPDNGRRRAGLVLHSAGVEPHAVARLLQRSEATLDRWNSQYSKSGKLTDDQKTGRPPLYTEDISLKIIAFYCQVSPLPGGGRWTLRWATKHLEQHPDLLGTSPSKSTIQRLLRNNALKPHQSRYFLHITDPDFFPKMEHLLALYLHPPSHLFFFDESPGIQILSRLTPDLRTEHTQKRLEEFEYIRNGTMDVFAFLRQADGTVKAECHADHTTRSFLGVFRRHVERFAQEQTLHYVMDNLSTHRGYDFWRLVAELSAKVCPSKAELNSATKRMKYLQSDSKRIVIHFTPFHGSWLNLVEIWFGIMNKKVMGETYSSAEAVQKAFMAFVEQWNTLLAHPFRWNYDGKGLHELAVKRFSQMLEVSGGRMELTTLTKCLKLMANLLNHYYGEISAETWQQLLQLTSGFANEIEDAIDREDGPQRKKAAEAAWSCFRSTLKRRLEQQIDAAA